MKQSKVGIFLGIPYDWRKPTLSRAKKTYWNSEGRHILTPHFFGWGWSINFYWLFRKIGLLKK